MYRTILSLTASAFIVITMWINPRIWLQDYPQAIQDRVPPENAEQRGLSLILGIPFLALLLAVPFASTLALKHQRGGGRPVSLTHHKRFRRVGHVQSRRLAHT